MLLIISKVILILYRIHVIYYFYGMIVCVRSKRNNLVEWFDLIHNYLIVNYKVTKNQPFALFV